MTASTRRDVLMALATLATFAAAPCLAQASAPFDVAAGRPIGEAWLAAHPGASTTSLRRSLLPNGLDEEAIARLRKRAAADFRAGRIFVHEGWIVSDTEARLFALLTLA